MNHEDQRPPVTPPSTAQTPPMAQQNPQGPQGPTAPPQGPPVPPGAGAPKQRRRGPRPVPPGWEYHQVLTTEKRQIWRGIAAIALLMGGMFAFAFGFAILGILVDALLGRSAPFSGEFEITPVSQAAALIGLALLLPWSMLIQRWLYGVKGASLHSVRSLFRFEVFGRAFLIVAPVWAVYLVVFTLFMPYETTSWLFTDLVVMFAVIILLTPLQSAGEEYGFRGLLFRVAASWGRGPRAALILGVVVSSLLFMVAHLALDPWLNIYYFTFGATLALITWRTGGLELAVVIHAVNNTFAFLLAVMTHSDLAEGMDRSVGATSPIMLLPCVILIVITAVVWFRTRHTGPPRTPMPEPGPGPESGPEPLVQRGTGTV